MYKLTLHLLVLVVLFVVGQPAFAFDAFEQSAEQIDLRADSIAATVPATNDTAATPSTPHPNKIRSTQPTAGQRPQVEWVCRVVAIDTDGLPIRAPPS